MDERGFSIIVGQNVMFIDEDEITATYNDTIIFNLAKNLSTIKNITTEKINFPTFVFEERLIGITKHLLIY